ncbi:polymorphic toxin-type HINT domain-containing protein [Streptomyces sp. NBC_00105]|uniref:polymorphic toxin-type HINT domain-containing protein n=1 Tax=unclassified Streptomyces TaxID=2593676 RepID=UPI002887D317|nr:polymorphic toxin-type HINT domain-containing protein [Streptomyces sp. DSM 41633]
MYLHVKQKIVTLLTVLCLTVGAGGTAAAADPADRDPTLLEIAARVAQYSKCRELPLRERPKCAKEFAIKSMKIGLGVGVYLYVFRASMEDRGASFAGLEKEVEELKKLKPLLVMDPHTQGDPKKQREVLEQFVKTYKAAKPNVDTLRTKLALVARATGPQADSVALLGMLVASTYFPAGTPQPEVVATGELGRWIDDVLGALDQINAGFDQMNEALDEMNGVMVEVNESIDGINKGLAQANRGMTQMNAGVTQMNKGLELTNTAVAGFNKAAERILQVSDFTFDFSHVGDSIGANSMSPEERADRERRMGLLLDMLPGIGDGKGIFQAITGKDMATSEQLSGTDRALGALAVLRWLRVGGKLIPDDILNARKGEKVVACLAESNSFPAGTRVLMGDGTTRPIEQVKTGDTVLATDPETGTTGPRSVDATIHTPDDRDFTGITLRRQDGQGSVATTDHHPFWSQNRGQWTNAADLNAGDTLRTPDGATVEIQKVTHWKELQPAYNLTVNDLHTYYVVAGDTPILVHNSGPCKVADVWNAGTFASPEDSFQYHFRKHGGPVNVTPQQYLQESKDWAARLAQPGGKAGLNAKRMAFDDGEFGVKYTDPNGGMGGIIGPDGKVVSFWYTDAH